MKITVNGRSLDMTYEFLTYEDVVKLVYHDDPKRASWYLETPGAVLTIVYDTPRDSEGRHRDGSLTIGGVVRVEEGMHIHGVDTGSA